MKDWKELINSLEDLFSKDLELLQRHGNPDKIINPPATNHEILLAEKRLGTTLPASYKQFLLVSNGLKILNDFYWDIFPVDQIQWLKDFDNSLIEAWNKPDGYEKYPEVSDAEYFIYGDEQDSTCIRPVYMENCIAVSAWGDAAIILLNPEVKFGDEWEAWAFANWYPGAARYKSFWDLMSEEFNSYIELRNNK